MPRLDRRRRLLFDQMLALFPPGRLVDLGTGHGQFALRAAAAGWDVTAVDGRDARFPAERGDVRWVVGDVRTVDLDGYDVVACLGLLYHLTLEDQLDLLRRCEVPLILDTHVANGEHTHGVSAVEQVGDYEGVWYREPGIDTSSLDNPRSFWPTPESFHAMLRDCGFPVVLAATPWLLPDRTFFLCLPTGYGLGAGRSGPGRVGGGARLSRVGRLVGGGPLGRAGRRLGRRLRPVRVRAWHLRRRLSERLVRGAR